MRWLAFALLSLILVTSIQATVIHVPADKTTIQGGINVAVNGDTVLVADGTYTGAGNRDIDFGGRAIVVMSENGPEATIIDCQRAGRGFHFHSRENSTAVLQGFTITNGYHDQGGGMFIHNSSPTIANCTFSLNETSPTRHGGGGGMQNFLSSPTITNCTFTDNHSALRGGGMYNHRFSSPTITNCTFIGNSAGYDGGGMGNDDSSNPTITNCVFSQNEIIDGYGAGMFNELSDPIITNCTFSRNSVGLSDGGGMYNLASDPTITNCTFTENHAGHDGAGMYNYLSNPIITNCIFWYDIGHEIYSTVASDPIVTYSDVMRGYPGEGNIDAAPFFTGPENNDYHLELDSPCVDAGDPLILDACIPPGLGEDRSDMGTYGGEENCRWPPYNYSPTITSSPDTLAVMSFEYYYDVEADDPDGDTLFFSLQVAPSWLSIDSILGLITGIPPEDAVGDTTVTVLVEDGIGGSDSQSYPLKVAPLVDVTMNPEGPTTVNRGGMLYFNTLINNRSGTEVEGDYWLTTLLPDSSEEVLSEDNLNHSNPISIQLLPAEVFELSSEMIIPAEMETGFYVLIGRYGQFPDSIADEESFSFRVYVPTVIHVPGDYLTIQEAIDASIEGDTVMVDPGTYYEHGIRFLGKAITVMSTNPEDPEIVASTAVNGDFSESIFEFIDGENSASILAGFTITGGTHGVYCSQSSPTIAKNIITGNSSEDDGGGLYCVSSSSFVNVIDNIIVGNGANGSGGGIYCSSSDLNIVNNHITGNSSSEGGGIYSDHSLLAVSNNVLVVNEASLGGGLKFEGGSGTVINNIISENTADNNGGGIICDSTVTISNAVIWGNQPDGISGGSPIITYSIVEGGWEGEGNIDTDPLFRDSEGGDRHLMAVACGDSLDSPCIDAGAPAIIDSLLDCLQGLGTTRSDMGAYGGQGEGPVSVKEENIRPDVVSLPKSFHLSQNYPNPFNPSTTILFDIPGTVGAKQAVSLAIYDLRGRRIRTLINSELEPGSHKLHWDGRSDRGERVASGVYLYTLKAGDKRFIRKMTMLK